MLEEIKMLEENGYLYYYNPYLISNSEIETYNDSSPKEYGQKLLNKRRRKRK